MKNCTVCSQIKHLVLRHLKFGSKMKTSLYIFDSYLLKKLTFLICACILLWCDSMV